MRNKREPIKTFKWIRKSLFPFEIHYVGSIVWILSIYLLRIFDDKIVYGFL